METLCNYTHPDLQNTTALARQPTGTLFPYNPDFYDLASGLYGPGNICTWYFLFASVFLHWLTGPRDADGHTHPGISADLIAVVAYPVFAATDLLVQGIKMIGTEDRALAIFCVRNPIVELEGMTDAFTQHEPLDMAGIPEEVVHFGQRVVDITGPLAVCYIFVDVSVVLAISLISEDILREYIPWRPTKMVRRFLFAGYGYVSLLLVVFHFSLGDVGISFFIALYEIIQPFLNAVTFGTTLVFGGAIVVGLVTGVVGIIRRDPAMMVDAAKVVGGMSIGALFPAFMITMTILNRVAIVPDLAVTITERDQLASLIAGILTLGYTIYSAILHSYTAQELAEETELGVTEGLIVGEGETGTHSQLGVGEDIEQGLPVHIGEEGTQSQSQADPVSRGPERENQESGVVPLHVGNVI